MDTADAQQTDDQGKGNRSNCNLEEIENLTCKAKRFEQQAKVMNEVAGDLQNYRQQYGDARQKYTDARDAAVLDLEAIGEILDVTWDQIRCRLTDPQIECMKQASDAVFEEIAECSDPPGCQSPCDDSETDPEGYDDIDKLAAEIARRRSNLADSAEYFKSLIAEPDTIKERVAKLKADAEALAKDVTAGSDSSKVPSLYARWLILKYWADLDRIGHGFASVLAYLNCLCGLLKCLVSGWTAVAILEGRKAELECFAKSKATACQKKKEDTLHVILDLYEECCGKNDTPTEGAGEKPTETPTQQTPETPAEKPSEPAKSGS
jgi:hypothetical protein